MVSHNTQKMTNLLNIGEHIITLPEIPTDKKEILFWNEKPENAFWDREKVFQDYKSFFQDFIPGKGGTKIYQDITTYNQDGELFSLNKEDSDWMIMAYEREWKRRSEGIWFNNGGTPTYLTGDHYFVLQWCKTKRPDKKSDFFDYREFQAWYFYLLRHVNMNEHIDGLFLSKAKKTGITNLHWLYYLNKSTMSKNHNLGNMNLDADKGAKTFRDHFLYAYNGLPLPLKANIKTKSETDGIITFGDRFGNTKKSKRVRNNSDFELNTTVMCVPTMLNAFDVDVFSDIWMDEIPKYKQDAGEIYRSNAAGTNLQDISVGKKWLTSYTPEGEAPSFMAAKEIFFDSELRTVTEHSNGRTKSGLICHHMPAFQSWTSSFDKYGRCNEQDASRKIQHGADQLKDKPKELLAYTRRYANSKKEAWSVGGAGSIFDNARLSEIYTDIEEDERMSPEPLYQEGRLEWTTTLWELGLKNKRPRGKFSAVKFVPLTDEEKARNEEGRVRIYQDVLNHHRNSALNNGTDEWGNLLPPSEFLYVLGADPTQHAAASEVIEGSKNAWTVMNRADERLDSMYGRVVSRVLLIEYFYRPELPDEAYEDLVKLIIYTGALSAVEANVPEFATRLMAEGLGNFMIVRDKQSGVLTIWKRHMGMINEEEKTYQLLRTTSNNQDSRERLEMFVRMMKNYFQKPEYGGKDYGRVFKSLRILDQLMKLDVANTRIADLFMSWGYCLLADEIYSNILLSSQHSDEDSESLGAVLRALAG